jgi:hypothetical protein
MLSVLRILIFTHPGFRIPDLGSRIPDPKTVTKERGEKKLVVKTFFIATHKNCKSFYFCKSEEKNLGQFSKNCRTFYPKNFQTYGLGIRDPEKPIPDPGVKKAPDPDPQYCWLSMLFISGLNL